MPGDDTWLIVSSAIPVSYSMADTDTFKRETDSLTKLASVQNIKRMIVITKDEENVVKKDGYNIEIMPLWKWLLNMTPRMD